ncbi:hypothetical protein H4R23_003950 [Coemansia sp. Cherry 401B]|nr:hypothetical protein H4R23_003950 [Coemansia sp. Cherry 401B]
MDARLAAITTHADQVRGLVEGLRQRVEDGQLDTHSGLSFLEVKHHTMLAYLAGLAHVALTKLHGQRLAGHAAVRALVEDRAVLEKMRPLEQRLKYQIDKLLRSAAVAAAAPEQALATTDDPEKPRAARDDGDALLRDDDALADPSAFRPQPGSLAVDMRAGADDDDGLYHAPKQAPVHYAEDAGAAQREKAERRLHERAARSRLVRDLVAEYDDRPDAETASGNAAVGLRDARLERLASDRARFEEDNFTRLAMGRRERRGLGAKLHALEDEFAGLNDFAAVAALRESPAARARPHVLDRVADRQQEPSNESPAEKAARRRRRHVEDEFAPAAMQQNKRTKFRAKARHSKR